MFISSLPSHRQIHENCHSAWNVTLKFAISEVRNRENPQLKPSLLSWQDICRWHIFSPDDVGFYVNKSQSEERVPALISQLWLLTSGTDTGRLLLSKLKNAFDLFEYQEERNAIYLSGRIYCPSFLLGKDKTVFGGMQKQRSRTKQLGILKIIMSLPCWIAALNGKPRGSCGRCCYYLVWLVWQRRFATETWLWVMKQQIRQTSAKKQGKESPMAVSRPAVLFSTHASRTNYFQYRWNFIAAYKDKCSTRTSLIAGIYKKKTAALFTKDCKEKWRTNGFCQ